MLEVDLLQGGAGGAVGLPSEGGGKKGGSRQSKIQEL